MKGPNDKSGVPLEGEPPRTGTIRGKSDLWRRAPTPFLALEGSGGITVGGGGDALFLTYAESLLLSARRMIEQSEFSIAVVVAHMACELTTERALSRAFAAKGIGYLEESLEGMLPSYNLARESVRKLCNALTGSEIQKEPFWQEFKKSAKRRNEVVHQGKVLTKEEAEASLKAATDLVEFLRRRETAAHK